MSVPFISGLLTFLGITVPFLGQFTQLFGIHARLLGFVSLVAAAALGINHLKNNSIPRGPLIAFLIFSFVYLVRADLTQIENLASFETQTGYYLTKLTFYVLVTIPSALLALSLRWGLLSRDWGLGFLAGGCVSVSAGLFVAWTFRSSLMGQEYAMVRAFSEVKNFSTIGLSLIILLGIVSVLHLILFLKSRMKVLLIGPVIILVVALLLLRQRFHAIITFFLLFAYSLAFVRSHRVKSIGLPILMIVGLALFFAEFYSKLFGSVFYTYWERLFYEDITAGRADLFTWTISVWLENPFGLGMGLGSFSLHHPSGIDYPHNILLEALFEFGIIGFLSLGCFLWFGFQNAFCVIRKFWADKNPDHHLLIAVLFLVCVLHHMKAGSINSSELVFIFGLLLPIRTKMILQKPGFERVAINEEILSSGNPKSD